MKIQANAKYVFYILIFVIFVTVRADYLLSENEIINIEFKSLSIANCTFPFGILKETILKDYFLPLYYFLIHYPMVFLKNTLAIKFLNTLIALINIFLVIKIGKQILNRGLGYLLGALFAVNHFFLYFTNLIAPYCLYFLTGTILIKTIIDFISKPNKKHTRYLIISNCIYLLTNGIGFLYVVFELFLIYAFFEKRKYIKKSVIKISLCSFFAFLAAFTVLIIQYYNWNNAVISNTFGGAGLNFNALYLMLSDFVSPYLSFNAPLIQTKSVLGMIYGLALNFDIKNINSVKILITLFYSSVLPVFMLLWFCISAYKKNFKLRFIFLISVFNFIFIIFLMLYETIDTNPVYLTQFFITCLILLGYGIYKIKDIFLRTLVIFCIFTIQFINPEINSFNVVIYKNYPVISVFNSFIKDYSINKNDFIIMPYMGEYAALYYRDLNFFNFDYSMLQKNNKRSMIRNLCNKNTASINKNNINRLIEDYLKERNTNDYLIKYFTDNYTQNGNGRIIIFVDKLNSAPISNLSIAKTASVKNYSTKLRKIDFRNNFILQNKSKMLFDAIKSRTLYNFINLICMNFRLESIIEYKKVDNEYFLLKKTAANISRVLNSRKSDYVFLVFRAYR